MTRRLFILAAMALSGVVAVLARQPETFALWCGLNIAIAGAWRKA